MQFDTFDQMAAVMSQNVPHALVQDWWSRLEATIRDTCVRRGASPREPISKLIDTFLSQHPAASRELIRELHEMRALRNCCAHGEAPPITAEEARAFAYRAWTVGWDLATKDEKLLNATVPNDGIMRRGLGGTGAGSEAIATSGKDDPRRT